MTSADKLTESELDALRECGNVGLGNAATSLSKIIDKKVDITLPETKFVDLSTLSTEIGGAESLVSGIYLRLSGDLTGQSLMAFSKDGALKIVDLMMGQSTGTAKEFGEIEDSAVKEMANIFIGSYLSAIGDMTELTLMPDVPHTATDMAQAVLNAITQEIGKTSDKVLIVKESIDIEGMEVEGVFLIMFDESSLDKLVDVLKSKYGL
jgi:chemotaxis protein CheC